MKRSHLEPGEIGERIRALRTERRLSQQKLAKRMGVARTTIGELESGQTATPAAETLLHLAEALDVDPWVIVYGRTRETPANTATPMVELFRLFADMPPLYQDLLLRFAREMAVEPPARKKRRTARAA